jgi:uncharacterized protein YyaL (SSP411 family)
MGLAELEKLLDDGRKRLLDAREKRVHPLKDDKILVAWNGLMIAALARGAQALGDSSYARTAAGAVISSCKECRPKRGGSIADTGRVR